MHVGQLRRPLGMPPRGVPERLQAAVASSTSRSVEPIGNDAAGSRIIVEAGARRRAMPPVSACRCGLSGGRTLDVVRSSACTTRGNPAPRSSIDAHSAAVAASEWGKYKINCNSFCPGALSPGTVKWMQDFPKQAQAMLAGIPLGRIGDLEQDIAPAVLFLASPKSDYVTGQTLMVDGGAYKIA